MSKFDNFKYTRWAKRINLIAQIVLCIGLWLTLNYIAANQFSRKDITYSNKFTLSEETIKYIEQIEEPVTIYLSSPEDSVPDEAKGLLEDIKNLLREYEYAGRVRGKKHINVEIIDIYKQSEKVRLLKEKFNIDPSKLYAIVVECGDNYKEVLNTELFKVTDDGQKEFRGEQSFTSAILNVANPQKQTIYWLIGHGEMGMDDANPERGMSLCAQALKQRNFDLKLLDLSKSPDVPEDADLIIIASPLTQIPAFEVEKLRRYLSDNNGRLISFLQPRKPHGLDELFWDWGILADDMEVRDLADFSLANNNKILINHYDDHPITDLLKKFGLRTMVGLSRPVRFHPGAPFDERLTTTSLMKTSDDKSWAERNYNSTDPEDMKIDPKVDLIGPISIAMVSERNVDSELGLNIPGGRLVVFGNANFVSNMSFNVEANHILFNNTINWILGHNNMLAIPPKAIDEFQLPFSKADIKNILLMLLVLPAGVAGLGGLITLLRRR